MKRVFLLGCCLTFSFSALGQTSTVSKKKSSKQKPAIIPLPQKTLAELNGWTAIEQPLEPAPKLEAELQAQMQHELHSQPQPKPKPEPEPEAHPQPQSQAEIPASTDLNTSHQNKAQTLQPEATLSQAISVEAAPAPQHELKFSPISRPHLELGFAYVHSRWSRFTDQLRSGSFAFSLGLSKEFFADSETAFSLQMIEGTADSSNQENVRAWHFAFEHRYFFSNERIRPFAALAFAAGSYRVWALTRETESHVVYEKFASGKLFGLIPQVGLRLQLNERISTDLKLAYNAYFDSPAYRAGGWSAGVQFGFSR